MAGDELAPLAAPPSAFTEMTCGKLAAFGGSVTVNCAFATPPPGAGVDTVTLIVVAVATSEASICTWSSVALTKVVPRAMPLKAAAEVATNAGEIEPVAAGGPLMVKIPPGGSVPIGVLAGDRDMICGTGFGGCVIWKVAPLMVVQPPGGGFVTVTYATPGAEMSQAFSVTASCSVSWL